jgi:hypothetical protein
MLVVGSRVFVRTTRAVYCTATVDSLKPLAVTYMGRRKGRLEPITEVIVVAEVLSVRERRER